MSELSTVTTFLVLFLTASQAWCFTMPSEGVSSRERGRIATKEGLLQRTRSSTRFYQEKQKQKCDPCQEPPDNADPDLSRREATFAMLGTVWAAGALPTSLLFPEAAEAAYGTDAKLELPNIVAALDDRQNKRCLVESLGNRECLVYEDPTNKLYQGTDNEVLLERIEKASVSLATLPVLIEAKKWSQVIGALTGPMGELIRTMGQLAEVSENSEVAKEAIKIVKTDLYGISAAVERKDVDKALKYHAAATTDLVAFAKSL